MRNAHWVRRIMLMILLITGKVCAGCNAPPGECCYEIGYLSRPLLFGVGGPDLDHHDAFAKMRLEPIDVTVRAGFFADSMIDALAGWIVFETIAWDDPRKFDYGWVDGHVDDEGDRGDENLSECTEEKYNAVASSLMASWGSGFPLGYNLVLCNCQDRAAQQL